MRFSCCQNHFGCLIVKVRNEITGQGTTVFTLLITTLDDAEKETKGQFTYDYSAEIG